jgi:hypothetical protein
MAAVFESIGTPPPPPIKTISLDDFLEKAKEEQCHIEKNRTKGLFIGGDMNEVTYPHVHVWLDGQIALSVGTSTNTKIGKDDEIDIDALKAACDRFRLPACHLNNVIRWVLCSAS